MLHRRKSVCVVAEGPSGRAAVSVLLNTANINLMRALQFDSQPVEASLEIFAQRICWRVHLACLKRPSKVIVVVDKETRDACPGEIAGSLEAALVDKLTQDYGYTGSPRVAVVVSDTSLENWFLADPESLLTYANLDDSKKRSLGNKVGPKADGKHAYRILQSAYRRGRFYHKTRDAAHLAQKVRVLREDVRRRSKSLDKLLRTAGVTPLRAPSAQS